ncbi:MAG: TerB family tellurite resistance protein [Paludibacteraceae bacterium]|nr:TerB family tellurite resistance protein [Paludibacteraceae bacterium]
MGFGKWITSGLGFVLFGPIGAIIGYIIGSMLNDGTNAAKEIPGDNKRQYTRNTYSNRDTAGNDFLISLLVLMAAVMKADGRVVKSELNVVKSFLLRTYGERKALDALQILKGLLAKNYDPKPIARQIGRQMNYSSRLELLNLLLSIAVSDGQFSEAEKQLLITIGYSMSLNEADINSLLSIKQKNNDTDWAYKILEINPSATDDEVKKAYRRMAMKYHPDKVNSLGEEMKKQATEKFRAVNEAYNHIKEKRRMT